MLVLHQFVASHFNEKARWALDYKNLPHQRRSYLPGPHAPRIRRLSGGATTTPLLEHDGRYVSGSASIIDHLEASFPSLPLYPQDGAQRERALALQTRFDTEVGPAVRSLAFAVMLALPGYLTMTFARGKSLPKRLGYRALLPLASPLIARVNGVQPDNLARARDLVGSALEEVATAAADRPYLIGDAFSVADLTAASLLAPLADIAHPDMQRAQPMPAPFRQFLDRWEAHPAIAWVHDTYQRHRPLPAPGP